MTPASAHPASEHEGLDQTSWPRTLVKADDLMAMLESGGPRTIVLDCRFSLADPETGRTKYRAGHIPGARYVHLDDDLSGPVVAGRTGRHPLPDPDELAQRFGSWGIDQDTWVVCVDDVGGAFAARAWWLLRWLGHQQVAVLDGGLQAWQAAGGPLETASPTPEPRTFTARVRSEALASLDDVVAGRFSRLVDSREAARYRGETEPIDPVAGHIPGAVNRPFQQNLRDGHFKSPAELHAEFDPLMPGPEPPGDTVFYCGSGVTAAHNVLAAVHAGKGEPRLYNGSWSEWIADGGREIAVGDET